MTGTLSGSNPPPGGRRRAVSRFKPGVARSVISEVIAVALTLITWAGLRAFDRSLKIGAPGPQIALAVEITLGLAAVVVPAYGARAIVRSLRASRLAREDRILDARTAAEDARDDLLYVIGFGLVAAIVAFGAFFLSAHAGRVRAVMF